MLRGRAHAVTAAFIVIAMAEVAAVFSDLPLLSLINRDLALDPAPDEEWFAADERAGQVYYLQNFAYLVGAITFIRWLRAAYGALDPAHRRFGAGWAIGAWFVPLVNLWRPKQIVDDIAGLRTALVAVWWGLYLVAFGLVPIAYYLSLRSHVGYRDALILLMTSHTLATVGAILAIVLVRRYTADGSRLREATSEAPSVATITPKDTPTGR